MEGEEEGEEAQRDGEQGCCVSDASHFDLGRTSAIHAFTVTYTHRALHAHTHMGWTMEAATENL